MIKETILEKEQRIIKEKEYQIITCDLCNKRIGKYEYDIYDGRDIQYDELAPEENKVNIGMIFQRQFFGDSGNVSGECFDICKECYEQKVKPLLKKELGLNPRIVEYDY